MWIETTGGEAFLSPNSGPVTIAMTDPTGTVVVEQMGADNTIWFEYKDGGISANLDSNTTARSIFAPIKLRVTATGTGVRLFHRKAPNKKPVIIRN